VFDYLRRFLPVRKAPPEPFTGQASIGPEMGVSGLKTQYGRIYEEAHRILRNQDKKWRLFTEMRDNDATIGAIMFAVEMMLRQAWKEPSVEPASELPADIEAAEFLSGCIEDMSHTWNVFISELVWYLTYGFSLFEIVYKLRVGPQERDSSRRSKFTDRKLGWRKFAPRGQETVEEWIFDDDGGLIGFKQRDPNTDQVEELLIENLLLFTTTSHKNNPEGRSILRNAYVSWHFKKHIEEMEAIRIEKEAVGLPVVRVPLTIWNDSEKRTVWEKLARDLRVDEQTTILVPSDVDPETKIPYYNVELIQSGGPATTSTTDIVKRHNASMAQVVLADWIFLGHEQVGSYSLSSDKTSIFATALGGWIHGQEEVINQIAVPRLFARNAWHLDEYPKVRAGDIETPDLEKLGRLLLSLSQSGAGIFPDDNIENWVLRSAGLPEKTEAE
jgi:hypothetical protein